MVRIGRATEAVLNVGALSIIVAGVTAMNDDVRRHIVNVIAGDRAAELSIISGPAGRVTHTVFSTIHGFVGSDATLVAFGVGAVVLFTLMFRS